MSNLLRMTGADPTTTQWTGPDTLYLPTASNYLTPTTADTRSLLPDFVFTTPLAKYVPADTARPPASRKSYEPTRPTP